MYTRANVCCLAGFSPSLGFCSDTPYLPTSTVAVDSPHSAFHFSYTRDKVYIAIYVQFGGWRARYWFRYVMVNRGWFWTTLKVCLHLHGVCVGKMNTSANVRMIYLQVKRKPPLAPKFQDSKRLFFMAPIRCVASPFPSSAMK